MTNTITRAELALIIVPSMASDFVHRFRDSVEKAAEQFARTVHNQWGVGDHTRQVILIVLVHICLFSRVCVKLNLS